VLSEDATMLRTLAIAAVVSVSTGAVAGEPLFDAVSAGDTAGIERLLSTGAPIDGRDRDRATPLIIAALNAQPGAAQVLLSKGADVMARNSAGFTPLHAAAYSGSVPVARLLLGKGAVLEDAANKAGATPLTVAAEENRTAMVEFLIERGADVSRPENHGYTPLTRAFWRSHKDTVRVLKRHGATCQSADVLGSEALRGECLEIRD
jgi:ankyrin repeat protein